MNKYIKRRLTFTDQEVREALIRTLADRSRPYPMGITPVKFTISQTGVVLEWEEDAEEEV